MKYIIVIACVLGTLLLTSGTTHNINVAPQTQTTITPVVVDMHVSEYPGPFLNMGGALKYHVLINGKIVGMHDQDVMNILKIFNITPYTSEQFHQLGLDNQIWAFERPGKGFTEKFISGRTR